MEDDDEAFAFVVLLYYVYLRPVTIGFEWLFQAATEVADVVNWLFRKD